MSAGTKSLLQLSKFMRLFVMEFISKVHLSVAYMMFGLQCKGGDCEARCLGCRIQEVSRGWAESPFIASNVKALSPEVRDLLDKIFVVDPL